MRWIGLFAALGCLGGAGCGATLGGDSASSPPPSQVVVDVPVPAAPPADRTDPPRPAAPGFGYLWIAGHWDNLDGIYLWKAGRWQQGRADYEYVRARYEFDTAKQTWIYHRPHWKLRHASAPTPAVLVTPPLSTPVASDGGAPAI